MSANASPSYPTLAALMSACSHALDLVEGQQENHSLRTCWIGMHIGQEVGIKGQDLWNLYYALLLRDLGSSSTASRICDVYLTHDLDFKRQQKELRQGFGEQLNFIISQTGVGADFAKRFRALSNVFHHSGHINNELYESRSLHGAILAQQLGFPDSMIQAIQNLDEHWNGSGFPNGKKQEEIPLCARVALLAQVVDIFYKDGNRAAACRETLNRSGAWFDPRLVSAFLRVSKRDEFWIGLGASNIQEKIIALEPPNETITINENYLDQIAIIFGKIVDAKSPYTQGHSERVAGYARKIGHYLGMTNVAQRQLYRAALLHDIGKLGISSAILNKPGSLDDAEWQEIRKHVNLTEKILDRIPIVRELSQKTAAYQERLDGKGYPLGLKAADISLETRIIKVADLFDALTAERPHRPALPVEKALDIIDSEVGKAVDVQCVAALQAIIGPIETFHERRNIQTIEHQQKFLTKVS